jgi:DNA polymerase
MDTRRDKLVALQSFANIETGELDLSKFVYENTLYEKAVKMKQLASKIAKCRACPDMNIKLYTESCPGWGNLNAQVFFVGQSLHEPGVLSGLPFIQGCGYSIDAALRLSGLLRKDVFFSNAVHCHPPANRPSTQGEKDNCIHFLLQELDIVQPKLIVALGNDARDAIELIPPSVKAMKNKTKVLKIKHPASFMYSAPEERIGWIVKLSLEIDKVLNADL